MSDVHDRLEELREVIRAECISQGELAELQSLARFIDSDDVELLEWAGVPEYGEGHVETYPSDHWTIDPPDYSVGIFSPLVVHETCRLPDDGELHEPVESLVGITFTPKNGYTDIRHRVRYTCRCGAALDTFDYDMNPWDL